MSELGSSHALRNLLGVRKNNSVYYAKIAIKFIRKWPIDSSHSLHNYLNKAYKMFKFDTSTNTFSISLKIQIKQNRKVPNTCAHGVLGFWGFVVW